MTGGLYRSAHAARDGDPPPADGATLISAHEPVPAAAPAGDEALPPEKPGASTAGQSAIMAAGSLVSRIVGFVRNALIGMTLGAGWYDNLQVVVTGFRMGSAVHAATFTLSASAAPTAASFGWSDIDRVEIAPVAGTGTPVGFPAGGGRQVYFDTIAVPEPAPWR